jgi:hypothetical protein
MRMRPGPRTLNAALATLALLLAAACSSSPDIPGSGMHSAGSSSGGSGSSSGSSGGSSGGSGSGAPGASSGGGPTITSNATWSDGQMLSGSVTIAPGATVTIAAGATVTLAAGAVVTVQGVLTASSATPTHAKLTGSGWGGIVVANGGTMTLDGVDLTGVTAAQATALDVQKGATTAEYDDGTIDSPTVPFDVEAGGALTMKHATVVKAGGSSILAGTLTAQFLDYDSNGHEGISAGDPAAALSIEDSKLHGSGPGADMLVASGAASFHVAYTDITSVHCAFHFNDITAFDISYSNVEGNAWGFMLYGSSGAGPRTISYSNIDNDASYAYDAEGNNGPITVDNCYVSGNVQNGTAVNVTNAQQAMVAGTGPRAM